MVSSLFVNNLLGSLDFVEFIRDQHRITLITNNLEFMGKISARKDIKMI